MDDLLEFSIIIAYHEIMQLIVQGSTWHAFCLVLHISCLRIMLLGI